MALIREVRGHTPVIGENTFLAETAVILGDVTIGPRLFDLVQRRACGAT